MAQVVDDDHRVPEAHLVCFQEYYKFVRLRSNVLVQHADLCFSMAASLPNASLVAQEADRRHHLRIEKRPWITWTNKPDHASPCLLTINAHEHVIQALDQYGEYIASGADDHAIKLWNATTGESVSTIKVHTGSIMAVKFADEGRHLISTSWDKTLNILDITTVPATVRHTYTGSSKWMAVAVDDQMWVAAYSRQVFVYRGYESPVLLNMWAAPSAVVALALSQNLIAMACNDEKVYLHRVEAGTVVPSHASFDAPKINVLAFGANATRLAGSGVSRTITIWDLTTDEPTKLHTLAYHRDTVCSIQFNTAGDELLSSGCDNFIVVRFTCHSCAHL